MLSARVIPSIAKYAQGRYSSYRPILVNSITAVNRPTCLDRMEFNVFVSTGVDYTTGPKPLNCIIANRSYSNQPSLPTKNEIEKVFFKVTVVIWDIVWKITLWALAMLKKHVILNPTVQSYWKTFNKKLEDARKE